MRAFVLLLLLANLLFAAWSHWVAPSRSTVDGRATPSASDPGSIRLLREAAGPAEAGEDGTDASLDLADSGLACVSAGPYVERPQAQQVEARLRQLGFEVRLRESREMVRAGDWVRIEDLATPEDAANALAQLHAAGLPDAYLLADDAQGLVISLGVFADPARAEQAATIAKMSGYGPRTIEREREADVFWLDIDRQASAGLPSSDQLAADASGAGPAVGLKRCPPAAGQE